MLYDIQNAQECADLVVKQALSNNSTDNISCMVVRFSNERKS